MPNVVTFGEIMLRMSPPSGQRLGHTSLLELAPGGAEANVAVALAQFGSPAVFVTRLPSNALADQVVRTLKSHGVDVSRIIRGGQRIGLYFYEHGAGVRPGQVIYDRAESAFAEAQPPDFDWVSIFQGAHWFHWSGITPALSPAIADCIARACAEARRCGLKVSFDMNYRTKLWSPEQARVVLEPLMEHVDLCVCGLDEARQIFGIDAADETKAAKALADRFDFSTVAMSSRRPAGADRVDLGGVLYIRGAIFEAKRQDTTIVDRLGAGDAFTAGLIAGISFGRQAQDALDFAVAACALKHTIPGDFLLASREEVEAVMAGGSGGRVQR